MANEKILQNIEGTDTIAGSWRRLLDRDRNVSNFFSGDDFTTDQKATDEGRPNWRTDLKRLFIFDGTKFTKLWDFLTPEEIAYTVDHPDVPADVKDVKAILDLIVKRNNLNTVTMPAISQTFSGSGTVNTFALERYTSNKNTLYIYINGIKQANDTFDLSSDGMSVVFKQAPAVGTTVEIMQLASLLEYDYSPVVVNYVGDGSKKDFAFDVDILNPVSLSVNIDGKELQKDDFEVLSDGKTVRLKSVPSNGAKIQMMTINKTSFITVSPNSIGEKELKQFAVTNSKIASNAVTGDKIKTGAVTVNSVKTSGAHLPDGGYAYTAGAVDTITRSFVDKSRANRTFGLPAEQIKIEYSRDGGTTWTAITDRDTDKKKLFSENLSSQFYLGNTTSTTDKSVNDQLRVTISTGENLTVASERYTRIDSLYVYISTNGNTCVCDLERATGQAPDNFIEVFSNKPMNGWSGPNIYYFGNFGWGGSSSQLGNTRFLRITFRQTAIKDNYSNMCVQDIRFYGDTAYTSSNNMMKNDHMYSWDENFNVTFPARVTAGELAGTLANNIVKTASIADKSVTTAKLADTAVTEAKLATDSVTTTKIKDGSVTTAKIADLAVTEGKLGASAVTTGKIKDGNVTEAKLVANAVTTTKIKDGVVTEAKLDSALLTKINTGSVLLDEKTIQRNSDQKLEIIGTIEKNSSSYKYDWVGTLAEWTAQNIATTHPDWVCYVTDDYETEEVFPTQSGNSGKFLSTNGTNTLWKDVLPTQSGQSGKFLTTNGTSTSWAEAGIVNIKYY